jgi:type II secretory pathway pseudopilin PulG
MRNQKGLTLIEVIGSITLLSIAVLGIIYILQQTTLDSKSNEKTDDAVIAARNVMEEIKSKLKSNLLETSIYGQTISLTQLRNRSSVTLYYPSLNDRRYEIELHSYATSLGTVPLADNLSSNLDNIFRRVTVTCMDLTSLKKFELEAFVEYQ